MTSQCPHCKNSVEHEDYLFEVACSCGGRFNPFMGLTEIPPLDGVEVPETGAAFKQSEAAFAEIAQFATGDEAPLAPALGAPEISPPEIVPPPPPPSAVPFAPRPTAGEAILTSGDSLPGYQIQHYLPPVSAISELDTSAANPLKAGFDALWALAQAQGGNGVVAVRWVLSPDGSRVILSGTPVQCAKE